MCGRWSMVVGGRSRWVVDGGRTIWVVFVVSAGTSIGEDSTSYGTVFIYYDYD